MTRIAWINQAAAVWLIVFVVAVLGDSATAGMIANDGLAGLVLLLCSWRVLTDGRTAIVTSLLQVACGAWLLAAPFVFGYSLTSLPARNDLAVGAIVTVVSTIETWAVLRHRIVEA